MSFLSGSSWQQPGIISGSSGYGQPSSGHQQQPQQQHKPPTTLSGANIPAALASSPLSPSRPASDRHRDWQHCQGQMAPGGQVPTATQGGSKITPMEDEVKLGRGRMEGTLSGTVAEAPGTPILMMPVLKIEEEGSRGGRPRDDGHWVGGAGGSLGSAGQSPSSPLSSHSSPSSSLPSPYISPGRSFPNSALDCKPTSSPDFGQSILQQNYTGSKDGFYIQGSQVSAQGQSSPPPKQASGLGERNTLSPCFTGGNPGNKEDEKKSPISSSTSGGLLGSLKENSVAVLTGNQTLKPSSGKQSADTHPSAADPAGSRPGPTAGPRAGLPPASAHRGESEVERENLSHTEKGRMGLCAPPPIHDLPQDLSCVKDGRVGSCATLTRETKTSQSREQPQRTAVRRAMSDCSHLSVPMVMQTYPTGMGGSPLMIPNMLNFALMGAACPPRAPYPHAAVRRSLTVTDGTEAAAAMATAMSSPLMTSPVMPSSPPPKRHHGSCETNFLLPVPPPAATSVNSTQDSTVNTTGKSFFLCEQ